MKNHLSRRSFLKRGALAAGGLAASRYFPGPNLLAATGTIDKLNCVQIGCGGRGISAHLDQVIGKHGQNLYAIVDPDESKHRVVRGWMKGKGLDPGKVQMFTDYRAMFERVGGNIDAVFIATPNHHHALAAELALHHGKNVYCEKPVCHDIGEARKLRALAARTKVATQMGNQGHCDKDGYPRLCEYIWAGAIGQVTETHTWTNRANGGVGPRPHVVPPPAGMNWDSWIGPAPFRDFHPDLHPHEWHGWYDFGNGSIGNMGCHLLDGVFWALKIDHPTSVEAEEIRGGSNERYPLGSRIRWDIPARGDMCAAKVYWYEGVNAKATEEDVGGNLHAARGASRNLPPLLVELQQKFPDEELYSDRSDGCTLYVGEKGVIYTDTYGSKMHVVPWEKHKEIPKPPETLPRSKDIFTDFVEACRAGKTETAASFEYGTRLTEFSLLGNLAQHAGAGSKVEWDGPRMTVKNLKSLNEWVERKYRKGWRA